MRLFTAKSASESSAATIDRSRLPRHVAMIMDGNGRWAQKRGLPRVAGHRAGAEATRAVVRAAGDMGLQYLTLFAFSSENWQRPQAEVDTLMGLLNEYLVKEIDELVKQQVRLKVIGQRERLTPQLQQLIADAEAKTAHFSKLTVQVALSYGGRLDIVNAVQTIAQNIENKQITADQINESLIAAHLWTAGVPDPDLVIRTSGEMRISNFLLWQMAYSELVFVETLWPDFSQHDLESAIVAFQSRDRRYGQVTNQVRLG